MTNIDWRKELALLRQFATAETHFRGLVAQDAHARERVDLLEAELATQRAAMATLETDHAALTVQSHTVRDAITDLTAKLADRETKQYAIKTNKEYQLALKEIDQGKTALKEFTTKKTELFSQLEQLEQKKTQLLASIADTETAWSGAKETYRAEREQYAEALQQAEGTCAKCAQQLHPAVRARYEFVQKRYAQAVVAVKNGVCEGCRIRVAPQRVLELRRSEQLYQCTNCARIVYLDE